MFGQKKEKPAQAPEAEVLSPDQDIIVHNMPSPARLGGSFSSSPKTADGDFDLTPVPQKKNFKTIGLVIIGAGIIFIGALVYLSYRFIISPTAGPDKTIASQPVVNKPKEIATVTPTIIPTPVPEAAPIVISTSTPSEIATSTGAVDSLMNEELSGQNGSSLPPLLDSDNDGLFNEEEVLLGTSATSTDSDGDKYGDLAELGSGYDPAGPGKLADNPRLVKYDNTTFNYSLLYPLSWKPQSLAEGTTVVFKASEDSLIQISVQDNSDKAGILGWYENLFPDTTAAYDQLLSVDGWDGIMGADNLNFYLTDSQHKNIYVVSYIPAVAGRIVYPNIFRMMLNSLVVK
ncbi:MAG: hypothetical protein NTY31_02075 [Candidatus Falkowbacteria bacterium]|nr:hypothetical protein [Candidatus Falkowbacteria bacterium]